jgi:3-isopropylmalate/(R)-2-methylmalate dehydratase small subunit
MPMKTEGFIHKLGDNIDTDSMIAGRFLSLSDPAEMAKHMFEESDPEFRARVKRGDVIVAGANFGSGSGREHAPLGLKALGIGCIVAASFARTFYRMCIDLGLPILTSPEAHRAAQSGQKIRVDIVTGIIEIDGRKIQAEPLPEFLLSVLEQDGMVNWVKQEVRRRKAAG